MREKIPLVDLRAQYKKIKREIDEVVEKVLEKANFIMGEELKEFELAFARFLGAKYAIGVSSGTDAIHLALLALGVRKGDEVILPAHTFTATAEPIVWLGAKPVFVDISEKTYTLDPCKVEKAITNKTKVIIPVHLYGHPADLASIIQIIKVYAKKIYLLEDCAQAHGAEIKMQNNNGGIWRKVGTIGEIGIFSFYPGKNLGAYGDAGMVVTNNPEFAEKIKLWRNHGRREKYLHELVGYGDRLDTLQAAILLAKLKYLEKWNKERRKKVALYNRLLKGLDEVKIPFEASWARAVYHLYAVCVKKREKLQRYLKEKGIETGIHYPLPLHLQPAYKFLEYKKGDLPVTEKVSREILSLPLFPELSGGQIQYICQCLKEFYS